MGIRTAGILCAAMLLCCGCQSQAAGQEARDLPELRIGCDIYEPYTYMDENGEMAGSDIELAMEACERMGVEPVFSFIKWDEKEQYLADGTIDCIWSCYSMTGREDQYLWVGPYMYSRQVVAVREDSEIRSLKDLEGKRAAIQSSTKPEELLLKHEADHIPVMKEIYCMEYMEYVFAALKNNYVDAAAGHESAMRLYTDLLPGEYRVLEESLQDVDVGIAFYKYGDEEMAGNLDAVLQQMEADGTTARILEKYGIGLR